MLRPVVLASSKGWLACLEDDQGTIVAQSYPALASEREAQDVARSMMPQEPATQPNSGREAELAEIQATLERVFDRLDEYITCRQPRSFVLLMAAQNIEDAISHIKLELTKGENTWNQD